MKKMIRHQENIFGMSNVLGKFISVEDGVPFSFYYSPRNSSHGPSVKPVINPSRMRLSDAGTLSLSGDWNYIPGKNDEHIKSKVIIQMKKFFRKYLVLFLLVWEGLADDPLLGYYFEGKEPLSEFIQSLDFYQNYRDQLDEITYVEQLEEFCRKNNLVNFYGN